jgi:hypothetical protein
VCGGKNESKALNMSKHKSFKGRKENCFWAKQEGKRRQVTHRRQVVNSEKEKKKREERKVTSVILLRERENFVSFDTEKKKVRTHGVPTASLFFFYFSSGPHRFFSFYMIHM